MEQTAGGQKYALHMKPLTGKLLHFLKMDKAYVDGTGNRLFYRNEDGSLQAVLDVTGGYGANLLGHKNPQILAVASSILSTLPPNHIQGAVSECSIRLARELSNRLAAETGKGPWICTLSNSGAEAVEAALKQALLHHKEWTRKKTFWLNAHFNALRKTVEDLGRTEKSRLLADFKQNLGLKRLPGSLCAMLMKSESLEIVVDCLEDQNCRTLRARPMFLAVEGGFHGKTCGALSVTANPLFRDNFFLDDNNIQTQFIRPNDITDIDRACEIGTTALYLPKIKNQTFSVTVKSIQKIAACIFEPVQGEGGIHPLQKSFVQALRKKADRLGFLMISDEIQAGMYRTGTLASATQLNVCADIYCFAKALGGGVAKTAATLIHKKKLVDRFGYLHTSTFAEDSFSSAIACRVLELLDEPTIREGMKIAAYLKQELENLQRRHPAVIREVRGRGLLIGVEFDPSIRNQCYELKFFYDLGLLGWLFSSALLNRQALRISPTMSNPLTLRLEPSLTTTAADVFSICQALDALCRALEAVDMPYFFGHLFPDCEISSAHPIPAGVIRYEAEAKGAAVFLSHVIRTADVKKIFRALENVPDAEIERILIDIFELIEFDVYFSGIIKGDNGRQIDAIVLSLPVPSSVIHTIYRSERSYLLIEKIQTALEYARRLGAETVGLGQFTSIVTHNGLSLAPLGMNVTTGNAYTVALAIEAGLRAASEKRIPLEAARIGFLGAAGNIVSVAASILADSCNKITLFYHTQVEASVKLTRTLISILGEISASEADSCCTRKLKCLIGNRPPASPKELADFLNRPEVRDLLTVETDLQGLRQCDILLTGTNASKPLIRAEYLKENALVIDVGVPGDVPPDLTRTRPDVTVIKGGIARMPQPEDRLQSICLPSFPLQEGQAFACMSETFSIGLAAGKKVYHVGSLSKGVVTEARNLAAGAGFTLSQYKDISTFDY